MKLPHLRLKKIPAPLVGLFAMVGALCLMNAQLIAGRTMLLTSSPAVVAAPSATAKNTTPSNSHESLLTIPKIGVSAPIVTDIPSADEKDVQKALQRGTLLFAGAPAPGEGGNTVIVGHSSNTPWAPGSYKYVFLNLDKLHSGDKIYAQYNGQQFTYEVKVKKVVQPSDVAPLAQTADPTLTLITCTPIGTNLKRLIIQATQISPTPTAVQQKNHSQQPLPMVLPTGTQNSLQATKQLFK